MTSLSPALPPSQSISIEHNLITKIPLAIFSQAPELTTLNLRDNHITTLPLGRTIADLANPFYHVVICPVDFGTWVSLTELDLGTNQLSAIPEDIQELVRLEELVLSNNAIRVSYTFTSW